MRLSPACALLLLAAETGGGAPPPPPPASFPVKGSNCGGTGCALGSKCECTAVTVMSAESKVDQPQLTALPGLHVHSFRIPAIARTPTAVIAFAEARQGAYGRGECTLSPPKCFQPTDDLGPKTIAFKRSTDSGRTWSKLSYIPGLYAPNWVVGNAAAVYDAEAGMLVLHVLNSTLLPAPYNDSMTNTGYTLQVTTHDDGRTWSRPVQLNRFLGHLHGLAPGPGNAIQLQSGPHKGRLLIPGWSDVCYDIPSCDHGTYNGTLTFSAVYWSDDHAKTCAQAATT